MPTVRPWDSIFYRRLVEQSRKVPKHAEFRQVKRSRKEVRTKVETLAKSHLGHDKKEEGIFVLDEGTIYVYRTEWIHAAASYLDDNTGQ